MREKGAHNEQTKEEIWVARLRIRSDHDRIDCGPLAHLDLCARDAEQLISEKGSTYGSFLFLRMIYMLHNEETKRRL